MSKTAETKQRIDKILSNYGYCSRNEANKWARAKRIKVDGEIVRDASLKVLVNQLTIDDEPIEFPGEITVLLNKPAGYVCSHNEGPRVYDLLPEEWMFRDPVPSVAGRLDKDSTGLVIITTDTWLQHKLISPKSKLEKYYDVTLDRPFDHAIIDKFKSGTIQLEDEPKPCLPAQLIPYDETRCQVILLEGKYHQVKRMFGVLGYTVIKLHRTQIGPFIIDDIPEGGYIHAPQDLIDQVSKKQ